MSIIDAGKPMEVPQEPSCQSTIFCISQFPMGPMAFSFFSTANLLLSLTIVFFFFFFFCHNAIFVFWWKSTENWDNCSVQSHKKN